MEGGKRVKEKMNTEEDTKTRPAPLEIPEFVAPAVEELKETKEGEAKEGEAKEKPKKAPRVKKDPSEEKKKRGPARPHRRLTDEVLSVRIEKLKKRFDKAKGQLDEAGRHLGGYERERQLRESDGAA